MCGILGMIGPKWAPDFPAALASLTHRGPDDTGTYTAGDTRLGHRRLSVIDLHTGHQPMATPDGRYHIVFNGEIYNFPELRKQLEQQGHAFTTHSDTEVLLHAFATWGRDALSRLDGIFAFAIWDTAERTLFAARDRFGIKPFFYAHHEGQFVFASTLEPFFKLKGFPKQINYHALRDYLASQSVFSPHTFLRSVHSLPPASCLTFSADKGLAIDRYWDIPPATDQPMDAQDLLDATDAALQKSVRRQMIADVPLGAFLSGGIDSSLMVRYMADASSHPVKTFSVRFDRKKGYDESEHAQAVASQFGCEHHVFDAREIDGPALEHAITQLDQPLADPAYLPLLSLSQLTRQHVTVAIAGDGGDELFGGYPRYLKDESHYPATLWHKIAHPLAKAGLIPGSLLRRTLAGRERLLWDRVKFGPFPRSRKSLGAILTHHAHRACEAGRTLDLWLNLAGRYADPIDTDALMRADLWTYLSENCLVKTDRASMAHSLEVRVPMLGNPVVDLILPQPASVKMQGGLKATLHHLAKRDLPQQVRDRPKHGFSVPLSSYFRGPWYGLCTQWIDQTESLAPFLNASAVRRRWKLACLGRGDDRAMYTLLVLLGWLSTHRLEK